MRRDEGFTIVEVLVAIVILTAGAIAVLGIFDAATRNTYRTEQSQVAINRAQLELEKIRQRPYDDIALTPPGPTGRPTISDPKDPRYRVSGDQFQLGWNGTTGSNPAEMVVAGVGGVAGGSVESGPTSFTSGDVHGNVYSFVVWQNDANCPDLLCPGSHDYKRVVIAVRLDTVAASYARPYIEVQSDFTDPGSSVASGDNPLGEGSTPQTAQQFFLTDTTCNRSEPEDPNNLTDHPEHQTTGACDDQNPFKPDGLYTDAPPDFDVQSPSIPALYDFATDIEPGCDGGASPNCSPVDYGLQPLRQDATGCTFQPPAAPYKIHRWVSRPMPTGGFIMSGQATLKLWTRTINDVVAEGTLCVFLFKRTEVKDPITGQTLSFTDTLLPDAGPPANQRIGGDCGAPNNTYFCYHENPWPHDAWSVRPIVMQFLPTSLIAGQRLGLEIALRRDGTTSDVIEFMYDHPDYASRIEIQTPQQLP